MRIKIVYISILT